MNLFVAIAAVVASVCAQDFNFTDVSESQEQGDGHRVVGGKEAPVGQYTWTVNLRSRSAGEYSECGGTLIAPDYVLTAAHCVENGKPSFVAVGTHYKGGTSDGEQISVVSSTSHPRYRDIHTGFDVAVLKLSRASKFAPLPLAKDAVAAQTSVKLLGWGQTSGPSGNPSSVLKENAFVVKSNDECQAKLRRSNELRGWKATATHLCAGGDAGQAACFGDSGGPLIKSTSAGFALVGDVSFGVPCGKGFPDVYGRVAAFRAFIDQASRNHTWV
ncbi:hypothetical protein DYB28_013100 [Aphanomyces astaci]|uniref:Peptidase S1 domain-containing protein n=1 Tax=Aphanomyces astaci TaxID=112090 RepID=A0A9X8DSZ7_APHAT|nr:hypothetical protein DYB28_013100 [Aphanomyces astaci]